MYATPHVTRFSSTNATPHAQISAQSYRGNFLMDGLKQLADMWEGIYPEFYDSRYTVYNVLLLYASAPTVA